MGPGVEHRIGKGKRDRGYNTGWKWEEGPGIEYRIGKGKWDQGYNTRIGKGKRDS